MANILGYFEDSRTIIRGAFPIGSNLLEELLHFSPQPCIKLLGKNKVPIIGENYREVDNLSDGNCVNTCLSCCVSERPWKPKRFARNALIGEHG